MAARPPQTISLAAPAAPVGVAKRAPAPILPLDVPPTIAIAMPKRAAIPPANAAAAPAAPPRAAAAPVPVAIPVATPLSVDESVPVSVRDLVLTWFEARGYRASAVSVQFRPIELQLRHRSDAGRNYAFVVERERVTGLRAGALLKLAKSAGHTRLLIAAEAGSDEAAARELRQVGVRIFDQALIRTELEKVDIRIAAKIIAVARGRDLARRSTPAATAAPARASARETAISAGA
jgi:hypothetical protein